MDSALDTILQKSRDETWNTLLPDELSNTIDAFLPSQLLTLRSKAFVVLSAFCQRLRHTAPAGKHQSDVATEAIARALGPSIERRLEDTEEAQVSGISFLSALFQVDWQAAAFILQQPGALDTIMDTTDIYPNSSTIAHAVAQLLGQASGHKSCRALISPEYSQWLQAKSRQTGDTTLRAAAAVALVKLSRGTSADASEIGGSNEASPISWEDDLVRMLKGLVVSKDGMSSVGDAVEGLAYLSTDPKVKELLCDDSTFLSNLFTIIPHRKSTISRSPEDVGLTPLYGTVVIISNLCAYRPRLTEEETQIAKLRRMAKPSDASSNETSDELDGDEYVKERGRKLIRDGVLDALTAAVRATDSHAVRIVVGKALLSLVEDNENRGKVLQGGGAKALMLIIQGYLGERSSKASEVGKNHPLDASEMEAIQALAKLSITASPVQVFGPDEGALYDAIRPLSAMLVQPASNLLQRFEALMALTNLSSHSAETASRIARADGLLNKVELLMLEDHMMMRRAATELICNLVAGCDEVFERYGIKHSARSKLQVLVALCDIDDLQTRIAASGALTTLTLSPEACATLFSLEQERHRVLPILGHLINPSIVQPPDGDGDTEKEAIGTDPGLVHRGVVCVQNFLAGMQDKERKELAKEAERIGLVEALFLIMIDVVQTNQGNNSPVWKSTRETIRLLIECGVHVPSFAK